MPLSFLLSFYASFLFSSSHFYTHTDTHFPSASINVPPLWIQSGCVWTFAFIITIRYLNASPFFVQTESLSVLFHFSNGEINFSSPLVRTGTHERELLSLVGEYMWERNTSVACVTLLFSFFTPSHALSHGNADPVLIFYGVWKKRFIAPDLHLPDMLGARPCPGFEYQYKCGTMAKHSSHKNPSHHSEYPVITILMRGSSNAQKGTCLF